MTQVIVEVTSNGELVLPKKIVGEVPTGTHFIVHKNKHRILVRPEGEIESALEFSIAQWLEALKANVINGVLCAEIEARFQSFPASQFLGNTWLDKGIIRGCEQAAIFAVARLFDTHKDAVTLSKFLDYAELHADEFPNATPEQVKQALYEHRDWISNNQIIPAILHFRNTNWGHTDTEALNEYFEALPYSTPVGFDMPQLEAVLSKTSEMVRVYSQFFDGQPFELKNMQEDIAREFTNYARFRLQSRSTAF